MDPAMITAEVAQLDRIFAPTAQTVVDPADTDWQVRLAAKSLPEQFGVAARADAVLRVIIARYADGDESTRTAIRDLLHQHSSFRWAVHLPHVWHGQAAFRDRLIHLSARDQASDTRDELLGLRDLCAQARADGVDIDPILAEVAEMSSTVDRYGMGSTRQLLLRCRLR